MRKVLSVLFSTLVSSVALAQNPIIQTCYTADPAPMVDGDRLYVCIDRDEGVRPDGSEWYVMNEWRIYSTEDMVNWTDHGAALPLSEFSWAQAGSAWASQCIRKGNKYYWYVCCTPKNSGANAIGVAVSDSPTGPFKDPLKKPLIQGGWGYIDPSPWIDDDGKAYLVFGNPGCFIVRLNNNMTSYNTSWNVTGNHVRKEQAGIWEFIQDENSFGGPKDIPDGKQNSDYKDLYEEGPWLMKRDSTYYLMYAAGGVPEHIAYSTSDKPTGPWTYRGQIMRLQDTGSFTNHSGICTFKGHNYFFYHTGWLPGGNGFKRSVAVEEFDYKADGSIPEIKATKTGVKPIATLNPYKLQEAETIAQSSGVTSLEENYTDPETGKKAKRIYISDIHNNDYIKVRNVEFGDSVGTITLNVRSTKEGGRIQIRIGSVTGTTGGNITIPNTEGEWQELTFEVRTSLKGTKDIFFKFVGTGTASLFDFDWWRFNAKSDEEDAMGQPAVNIGEKTYYSLSGTKLNSPQKGINIIALPDGRRVKRILP